MTTLAQIEAAALVAPEKTEHFRLQKEGRNVWLAVFAREGGDFNYRLDVPGSAQKYVDRERAQSLIDQEQ